MNYKMISYVSTSGFAETGISGIINDRFHQLRVPWEASETGSKNIIWIVEADDGNRYKVTVPVYIQNADGEGRASYQKGAYSIELYSTPQEGN